jgi:hypothetical protein
MVGDMLVVADDSTVAEVRPAGSEISKSFIRDLTGY